MTQERSSWDVYKFAKAFTLAFCLGMASFHVINHAINIAKSPVSESSDYVPLEVSEFSQAIFCFKPTVEKQSSANFPLGYYTSASKFDYIFPKDISQDTTQMSKWNQLATNSTRFVDQIQILYDVNYTSDGVNFKPIRMIPRDDEVVSACGVVQPHHRNLHWLERDSWRRNRATFQVRVKDNIAGEERTIADEHIVFGVSLYKTESVQDFAATANRAHMIAFNFEPKYEKFTLSILAMAYQHRYLNRRSNPCIEPPPGYKFPSGYLRAKCNRRCRNEAVEVAYNCTPFRFRENKSIAQPCYWLLDQLEGNESANRLFATTYEECRERLKCKEARYCNEWEIVTEESSTSEGTHHISGKAQRSKHHNYHIIVLFNDRVANTNEYYVYDWENVIGRIGGFIGIYLGLSVVGSAWTLIEKWSQKKK